MSKFLSLLAGLVLVFMAGLTAQAATLTVIEGQVKVNRGNGYQTVTTQTTVNPGDKIVVAPNGHAQLVYPNGTVAQLTSGVTTVSTAGTAGAATAAAGGAAGGAGAAGAAGALGGLGTAGVVAGAVAVAAGVGLAVSLANDSDKKASP